MIARIKPKTEPTPGPALPRSKYSAFPLVELTYIPGAKAYLIVEGPEQSEIKWAHNGNTVIVCNNWIKRT